MFTKGRIIIITAPSGSGKTSITHYLMNRFPQLAFSVSAATRAPRNNEQDGIHYHFMTEELFREKIRNGEFVEWEMVYEGKYYGTLKDELERIWARNQVPVLDIDVKGAIHVQQQYPDTSLSLFIQPPSIEELRARLKSRGTETEDSLETRVNKAAYEISFKIHFNKVVVNDNLNRACEEAAGYVADFLSPDLED